LGSIRAFVVLIFAGLSLVAPRLAVAEPLRFATINFEPYALDQDSPDRRGFIVDVHAAIAARADLQMTENVLPIARLLKNLERGLSDCSVFLLSPWSKANFVPVAEIMARFPSIIVTRKDLPISRVEDLHGKNLALPRGSYREFPIATDPKIQRQETGGYGQSARLLKAGRVDAIAGTALSIYHYLEVVKLGRQDIGGVLTFDYKPIWLQCNKTTISNDIKLQLQKATDALRAEGAFEKLRDRYIPESFRQS
jgi:ABC-type amino acid transport substrate-binding protein